MNDSGKKNSLSLNIGSSSILLIFVIICLIAFAALSLSTAIADKKLSDRISDRTLNYYKAVADIETQLNAFDRELAEKYADSADESDYFDGLNDEYEFSSIIDDRSMVVAVVVPTYPTDEDDTLYEVKIYNTQSRW